MFRVVKWLLCASVWTTLAWAAEPRTYPREGGVQVFLGLDDTSAPTQVKDGRAQDVQNVLLDSSGSVRQRYGTSLIVTAGTDRVALKDVLDISGEAFCAVTGLYYTKFSSGTEKIIATCGNRFYTLNGISSWDQVALNPAFITSGQNNQFVWATALDEVIGTNDVDAPVQYNGTRVAQVAFTGLTSPIQRAKTVIFFKNYLIFGNTRENSVEYSTRIRWSNVGTINAWDDDDYIDIGALGGQEINCVAELYDNLYIGLSDSIYKISLVGGADTFQVSKITDDIGCIAKNSIQSITLTNAQSGLIFLDKDKKIYFFNGVIAQDISKLITTVMGGLSGTRLQYAVSADTNTDYLLCVTSGTGSTNNLCLDLQYELGEWTKHTNIPANAMAHVIDNNSDDKIYWGSYKSLVYQFADENLRNDVYGVTGTVKFYQDAQNRAYTDSTATASGLSVLYDTALNLTTGALVGAPIEIIAGTGILQTNTVADNDCTGIIVTDAWTTQPDTTSSFEVGAIDSYYTTKWYDFGEPARLKHFGEVYFWADADVSSTHSLAYATDFNATVETLSLALTASSTDSIWGSAIWGVSLWGSVDTVFRQAKLQTNGRYLRLKWQEDDLDENFHLYGFVPVWFEGDIF